MTKFKEVKQNEAKKFVDIDEDGPAIQVSRGSKIDYENKIIMNSILSSLERINGTLKEQSALLKIMLG